MKPLGCFLLIAALLLMLSGCGRSAENARSAGNADVQFESAKEYVESDAYIDFDVMEMQEAASDSTLSPVALAKSKAAVYRFYRHVTVEDGLLQCSLKNGAEINVSDRVFKAFMDNLNEMNEQMQALYDKGDTVDISDPTEEYLNSLLD